MMHLERLFDSEECETLREARKVLERGIGRLKGRVPAYPSERGARASETARQAREAITSLLMMRIGALGHEQGVAVLFDAQGRMIAIEEFPEGELTSCTMPCRTLARMIVNHSAALVLLAHNHPSGACSPSRQDEVMHKAVSEWVQPMQCEVVDSLVFTVDDWCSIGGNWTC